MSEPSEIAGQVEEVAAAVYHWRVSNSMIGGSILSSHATPIVDYPKAALLGLLEASR